MVSYKQRTPNRHIQNIRILNDNITYNSSLFTLTRYLHIHFKHITPTHTTAILIYSEWLIYREPKFTSGSCQFQKVVANGSQLDGAITFISKQALMSWIQVFIGGHEKQAIHKWNKIKTVSLTQYFLLLYNKWHIMPA